MLHLSTLGKTWILDVDGTLVKHNGYKIDGYDTLLPGVETFFANLSPQDKVILLTARLQKDIPALKAFLAQHHVRYDYLLSELPTGERILVNDTKPSGLCCGYAVNKKRDEKLAILFEEDPYL